MDAKQKKETGSKDPVVTTQTDAQEIAAEPKLATEINVDEALSAATSSLMGFWSKVKSTGAQLDQKIGTYLEDAQSSDSGSGSLKDKLTQWGSVAGDYLDKADRRIEEMENQAAQYLKGVGKDLQHIAQGDMDPNSANDSKGEELLFAADTPLTTSRLDAQLNALHSKESLILDHEAVEGSIESRKAEIALALKENDDLQTLQSSLVPAKLSNEQFWLRYFKLRDGYVAQDAQRKKIIAAQNDQEEASWDSSDEESDIVPVKLKKHAKSGPSKEQNKQEKAQSKTKADPDSSGRSLEHASDSDDWE